MLIFQMNLILFIIPSVVSSAVRDDGEIENRLSFVMRRNFLLRTPIEHLLLVGQNSANISTNDSIFNIHFRYSIHDRRLVIMDSNDDHELYKVMCDPEVKCRILKDGRELLRVNGSALRRGIDELLDRRRSIDMGYDWTISTLPDQKKVFLFHARYSVQQPIAELVPFEMGNPRYITSDYLLHIAQQSDVEPAFIVAMGIIVATVY